MITEMILCRSRRSPRRFEGNTALRNVITHSQKTRYSIPANLNPRQDRYEYLKSRKFAVFYINRTIIIMRKEAHQKSLPGVRLIQSIPSHPFFKLHFNIFLPSTPRSSKRCLAFPISQSKLRMHFSPVGATCPTSSLLRLL